MTLDKLVVDDYEARFREYEDKVNTLAADLLEERQKRRDEERQRREVGEALVRVTEEGDVAQAAYDSLHAASIEHTERHRAIFDEHLRERAQLIDAAGELTSETYRLERERDEARERANEAARRSHCGARPGDEEAGRMDGCPDQDGPRSSDHHL